MTPAPDDHGGAGRTAAPTALTPGRRVRLEHEAAGAVCVGEVTATTTDRLAVRLLDPAPEGSFRPGSTIELTLSGPDGLYRATTTVGRADLEDDGGTLDLRPPDDFDVVQRRAHPRVPVSFPVTVRRVSPSGLGEPARAQAEDLSRGGIRLAGRARLDIGNVIHLELPAPEEPLRVQGLVVGTRPGREGGRVVHVAFSRLEAEAAERLDALVGGDAA